MMASFDPETGCVVKENGEEFFVVVYSVHSANLSLDGKLLATGDAHGYVVIFDITERIWIKKWKGHNNGIYGVSIFPDGKHLVSCGYGDRSVKVWDMEEGESLMTLDGHTDGVHSVAYSPNGLLIVSASFDSTARIWCAKSGKCADFI